MNLCPDTGKRCFKTRVQAARATAHLGKGAVRLYRCVWCGAVHATSKPRSARGEFEAIGRRRAS